MTNKDQREERERHRRANNKVFILEAAETVFAQWGYSLVTMDTIAEEAQFSKATLYRYFRSKKEIFLEIIQGSMNRAYEKIAEIYDKPLGAEDKLREYIKFVMSYYEKKESFIRIIFMEKSALKKVFNIDFDGFPVSSAKHPKIPSVLKTKMKNMSKIMSDIIKDGIKAGEFQDVNVEHAGFVLGAMIRGFHFRGPVNQQQFSVDKSVDVILQFFLDGIRHRSPSAQGV